MYDVLVLAQGMYDQSLDIPLSSRSRTIAAIKWVHQNDVVDRSTIYFSAYKPPMYDEAMPALAEVMKDYAKDMYDGKVVALTEPCNFTTKGEISKFLLVSVNRPVIVSGKYHLLRIFFYLWEARGLSYAKQAIYVTDKNDNVGWRQWLMELFKIFVIILPETAQSKLEYWHAQKTHKLVN